jgi:hypothetical protein
MNQKALFMERVSTAVAVACIESQRPLDLECSLAEWSSAFAKELWDCLGIDNAAEEESQEQNTVSTVSANQPCTDCKHVYASADQLPCTLCTTSRPSKWEKAP